MRELSVNQPEDFERLNPREQYILLEFCKNQFTVSNNYSKRTSYGLKHYFECFPMGFYITNGQFKGAMLKAGYKVKDKTALNWQFNIDKNRVKALEVYVNENRRKERKLIEELSEEE